MREDVNEGRAYDETELHAANRDRYRIARPSTVEQVPARPSVTWTIFTRPASWRQLLGGRGLQYIKKVK